MVDVSLKGLAHVVGDHAAMAVEVAFLRAEETYPFPRREESEKAGGEQVAGVVEELRIGRAVVFAQVKEEVPQFDVGVICQAFLQEKILDALVFGVCEFVESKAGTIRSEANVHHVPDLVVVEKREKLAWRASAVAEEKRASWSSGNVPLRLECFFERWRTRPKAELPVAGDRRTVGSWRGENGTVRAHKPRRRGRPHPVCDEGFAHKRTEHEFFRGWKGDRKFFRCKPCFGLFVLRTPHPLGRMNEEGPPVVTVPAAVFSVFSGHDDQPGPRLSNGQCFQEFHSLSFGGRRIRPRLRRLRLRLAIERGYGRFCASADNSFR